MSTFNAGSFSGLSGHVVRFTTLALLLATGVLHGQETCIEDLPPDPTVPPASCDGITWCDCLSTSMPFLDGGLPAVIDQHHVYVAHEGTAGSVSIDVDRGTVDTSALAVDSKIGEFFVVQEIGEAEPFLLSYDFVITEVDEEREIYIFESQLQETNDTSVAVLTYDPFDEAHSNGRLHLGELEVFGDDSGFIFRIHVPLDAPEGEPSISLGDLTDPNFTTQPHLVLFGDVEFDGADPVIEPLGNFTLPAGGGTLVIESEITNLTNPLDVKGFEEEFEITPGLVEDLFLRGDVDGNGRLEVTDPINTLSFQFLGTYTPPCLDACDFDDNGKVEITDAIGSLSHQFLGTAPPPPPGKEICGVDPTDDAPDEGGDLGCENPPTCE